jgi:hypothetical protein
MTSTFKQSKLMKFMHDEDSLWNSIPYELKCKGEIECYDKLNELHPEYPIIIYNHALRYKQRLKKKRLVISSTNDTSN